jgi:hypothetical protein
MAKFKHTPTAENAFVLKEPMMIETPRSKGGGEAGDFLTIGVDGRFTIIPRDTFLETYEADEADADAAGAELAFEAPEPALPPGVIRGRDIPGGPPQRPGG